MVGQLWRRVPDLPNAYLVGAGLGTEVRPGCMHLTGLIKPSMSGSALTSKVDRDPSLTDGPQSQTLTQVTSDDKGREKTAHRLETAQT
jgi:hypothetical protein